MGHSSPATEGPNWSPLRDSVHTAFLRQPGPTESLKFTPLSSKSPSAAVVEISMLYGHKNVTGGSMLGICRGQKPSVGLLQQTADNIEGTELDQVFKSYICLASLQNAYLV